MSLSAVVVFGVSSSGQWQMSVTKACSGFMVKSSRYVSWRVSHVTSFLFLRAREWRYRCRLVLRPDCTRLRGYLVVTLDVHVFATRESFLRRFRDDTVREEVHVATRSFFLGPKRRRG